MTPEKSILVVATPDDAREIAARLAEAGLVGAALAAGGDETLVMVAELRPCIVILAATLEQGDARALAAAIRAGREPPIRIVLVGDPQGPIRNALDASDFEVDRFVGRPLSAKALGFAVRACLDEADPAATRSPPASPLAIAAATPAPTATSSGLDRAMEDAISDFVQEALGALVPASAPGREAEEPPGWARPAATWREPTLILSGGGAGPAAVVDAADLSARERGSPWDPDRDVESSASHDPDEGDEPDEPATDDDRTGPGAVPARPLAPIDDEGSGAMARELRRKMSAMADRLFPGRDVGERSRLDVGLAHDAHTEIDLSAIGGETVSGAADAGAYRELATSDTFADTNPLARREPTPTYTPSPLASGDGAQTTARRRAGTTGEIPRRGDLADLDVATLCARLCNRSFSGRLVLRRPPAEKMLLFEDGRPVFATSNLPHDRMGDLLFREGKITREQHGRAKTRVVESGRRMGEILVDLGFIKPRELLPTVRRHLEDIIYSLFAWDRGEFTLAPGDAGGERIRLTRHPAALILEGLRRKLDPEALTARLDPGAVVAVRAAKTLAHLCAVADLAAAERAMVARFDGEHTVAAIAAATQMEVGAIQQVAIMLLAFGAVEVVHRGAAAVAQGEVARVPALVGETDLAIDRQRVRTKHALVGDADYFLLLGVRRDATGFEIRRAYEAARRDFAADGFPPELARELAGELREIGELLDEAYQILRDDRLRRSYLSNLRE